MSRPARLLTALLAFALSSSIADSASAQYAGREDVRQFIAEMVDKHGFAREELRALFSKARFQPAVILLHRFQRRQLRRRSRP